ncbi:MAG: phenylacetate--CoA ligase family protein [Planctomycetales bacterium]|nr:phenylacetate--CoA ligase family protein [Planctomycetales bacterium]
MKIQPAAVRRQFEALSRSEIESHHLARLNALLSEILPANQFYAKKLGANIGRLESLEQLRELPFTEKDELASPNRDLAANHTFPVERYSRFHRTSGTKGKPMVVLDTADDWHWWIETWQFVLDAAELTTSDRVAMAFSFGPFIGFWTANDAIAARGALVIPGGGMDTLSRLDLIRSAEATVICCTPTYAMRLAEVAIENNIDIVNSSVDRIIVAGEPGGSIPSIRDRIESAWNARVIDHSGATEVGPWGFADRQRLGLHIAENEFIAEFLSVDSGEPAKDGELSQLVLTSLGRVGCPVIRYRTGDLVRPRWNADPRCNFVLLEGGVLGRADDMMIIRGVNVFPSSIEQILRTFPSVAEYRITATREREMDQLHIEIEAGPGDVDDVAAELKVRLGLNVAVTLVDEGTLPRFEAKGKRFVDQRDS